MRLKGKFQDLISMNFRSFNCLKYSLQIKQKKQLNKLKTDKGLAKRYKAVTKTIRFLSSNPRHNSLNTHEFTSLKGPKGEKAFVAYAEQSTPAAYRVFWYYGPEKNQITIVAITPHP